MELLSPLELKRRNREFMLYNQNCLEKSWVDVSFLGKVRSDPNLLLKQFVETAPYLEALTSSQYKDVRTFTVRVLVNLLVTIRTFTNRFNIFRKCYIHAFLCTAITLPSIPTKN